MITINPERDADGKPIIPVMSRFERDDIVLKLACIAGQADANGDLALQIKVPGTPGTDYRYAAGGYATIDAYTWGDKLKAVEIVDVDDIMGFGAGTVLKTYHDAEAPEANQGWYFWQAHGTQGEVEIEPMGWYGQIPAGLYLRCTFKVAPLKNIQCAIWWGKVE